MTRQAMLALMAWSSEQPLFTQAQFVDFLERWKGHLVKDDALGADASGIITYQMVKDALREFDGTELD